MNNLRTKIFASFLFLFIIIMTLGFVGSSFISQLAVESGTIIKDNYHSMEYSSKMQDIINRLFLRYTDWKESKTERDKTAALESEFEKNLKLEVSNITESGEAEIAGELKENYYKFKQLFSEIPKASSSEKSELLRDFKEKYTNTLSSLRGIYSINMKAILYKNSHAGNTARRVSLYMIVLSVVSSFISLLIMLYLPKYLVRPVHEMTSKMREISSGNYDQELKIHSSDEFGEMALAFNTMSLKLKEYENKNIHKLLVEKKRTEAVIDSLTDAIMVLDENKIILSANQIALEITGMKASGLIGKYAPDVAANNDLIRELIKDLMEPAAGKKNKPTEPIQILVGKTESYFTKEIIEIKITAEASESLVGYVLLLKNITTFKERDSAKTNLIATVSHELKTPISSINLSLKLLEKISPATNEQQQVYQTIRQQTSRLSKMVNELLDYSQAESGNIKLRLEKVLPSDIIDYAVVAMMMIVAEKKIQLEPEIQDNLPYINADVEKTVWVLVNLINNAVRYTPEGGVVKIRAEKGTGSVVISVIDQGPGIPAEDQEKIFSKFVQIGNHNPKGRGLGLAISKEFVLSQGGDIRVESEIGAGSKFSFRLPAV